MPNRQIQLLMLVPSLLIGMQAGCSGIGSSRWASDDPVYSEKYDNPYEGDDGKKIARMLKQSVDARHVKDRSGYYLGGAYAEDSAVGADVGMFLYQGSAVETRTSLKAIAGAGTGEIMAGLEPGIRIQTPSRLAPFVGAGTFIGGSWPGDDRRDDGFDNDFDGVVDDYDESDAQSLVTIFPEIGAHFWLNSSTRLTTSAQYHFSSEGRDDDFVFVGFSVAYLNPIFNPEADPKTTD